MNKLIIVYTSIEGEIKRVGLYEDGKWVKWISKKSYKIYAKTHNIEIIRGYYKEG